MDIQVPELVNEIKKRWGFSDNQIGWLIGTSQQNIANWRRGIHKRYDQQAAIKLYEILQGRLSFKCDPICLANFIAPALPNTLKRRLNMGAHLRPFHRTKVNPQ